uniref:Uncharacterized protein n=1 Tax=Leptobrachium leishanense TaxID=445787 RepID=A0A8C5QFC1_9ANUR
MKNELQWIQRSYDVEHCQKWVKHARKVQKRTKDIIKKKIQDRFDMVAVPRNLSIMDFCLNMGINLQLTQGSGFYQVCHKEILKPGCRVVLYRMDTEEFIDDVRRSQSRIKLNSRKLLNAPPFQLYEVDPDIYPDYKVFFENKSKNRILKANSLFLYQVFPENTSSWLYLLHQAIPGKQIYTVENLLGFFRETSPDIINELEPSTGQSALHVACQSGQFNIALLLLESGASINKKNGKGHAPLDSAMLGQHRGICQLLIEWGCRVPVEKPIDVNSKKDRDLRSYCKGYSERWRSIVPQVIEGNSEILKKLVDDHKNGLEVLASLRSRCIDGSTLLHVAAYYGEVNIIQTLLNLKINVDLLDYRGATPLQRCRDVKTMQLLLNQGADINWRDEDGNTALHMVCFGEPGKPSRIDSLILLMSQGASMKKRNTKGLQPVHCAAMQGRIDVIHTVMETDAEEVRKIHEKMMQKDTPSLPFLALANNHLECAKCALHLAALRMECYEILQLLLSSGCEVDIQNDRFMTPLFNAASASNTHGAKLLLDYGANVEHMDDQGFTAFAHIHNADDWIASGIFSDEINELLRAYELHQSIRLVKHVAIQISTNETAQWYARIKDFHGLLRFRSRQYQKPNISPNTDCSVKQ